MGIISKVGRKSWVLRAQIASLHLVLGAGALSILVPFIFMLSTSLAGVTDVREVALYPRYLLSAQDLYKKFLAAKNNEDLALARSNFPVEGRDWVSWMAFNPRLRRLDEGQLKGLRALRADWEEYLDGLPGHFVGMSWTNIRAAGPSQMAFQDFLQGRYKDVEEFNAKNGSNQPYLSQVTFPSEGGQLHFYADKPLIHDYLAFKQKAPSRFKRVYGMNDAWAKFLYAKYRNDIALLNKAWKASYADPWFNDVPFPLEPPRQGAQRADWTEFLRTRYPMLAVSLRSGSKEGYHAFLRGRFKGVAEYNQVADTAYRSWDQVPYSSRAPSSAEIVPWAEYARTLPLESWQLDFPELRWKAYLLRKYGGLEAAGKAYGLELGGLMPVKQLDELYFQEHRGSILWHFLSDNYVQVSRFMLMQGRAAANTLILVALSVITALLVNPLAAYALSRYRLSYTSKILLFLLATAAFPVEVTQIPQFLLMKKMGMLNTFSALVLPGIANGFFIFLLKGFFDSLPKEIYEAAILDGASESVMFRRIAVPLAAPILAVIALGAFTYAYSAYQFAIVVCPDPKMWTLMVYLQQFMNSNPYNLVMASFVLASIPTLVVFLLAQRTILRGIVIPTMH